MMMMMSLIHAVWLQPTDKLTSGMPSRLKSRPHKWGLCTEYSMEGCEARWFATWHWRARPGDALKSPQRRAACREGHETGRVWWDETDIAQSDTCGVSVAWEGQHDRTEGREVTLLGEMCASSARPAGCCTGRHSTMAAICQRCRGVRSETLDRALL